MKENFKTGFDQLKNSIEKSIEVERPNTYIGLSSVEVSKPFQIGETFPKLYPHQTENGKQHKGKVTVVATNEIGNLAVAKCVLPNCNKMVLLKAKEKQQ